MTAVTLSHAALVVAGGVKFSGYGQYLRGDWTLFSYGVVFSLDLVVVWEPHSGRVALICVWCKLSAY
jgi:hypothetical protein